MIILIIAVIYYCITKYNKYLYNSSVYMALYKESNCRQVDLLACHVLLGTYWGLGRGPYEIGTFDATCLSRSAPLRTLSSYPNPAHTVFVLVNRVREAPMSWLNNAGGLAWRCQRWPVEGQCYVNISTRTWQEWTGHTHPSIIARGGGLSGSRGCGVRWEWGNADRGSMCPT